MFNDDTSQFEFVRLLNNNNFTLLQTNDVSKMLQQAKNNGKVCQLISTNDDLSRSLGIKVIRNKFSIKNTTIYIYLFLNDRFPGEIPNISLSEDIYQKDFKRQDFKFPVHNLEEFKKDGKFNITVIINKVQQQITRLSNKIDMKFISDFQNLKTTFNPQAVFAKISNLNIKNLLKNPNNATKEEISQQYKLSAQYQQAVTIFNQLTQLNDSVIKYLRTKHYESENQKNKILQQCFRLQKVKKQFMSYYINFESLKNRVNKFNIMQLIDEKIKSLNEQIQECQRKQFSANNFNYYKSLMKELKKLQLKKERLL